jgi:hypothetical protein
LIDGQINFEKRLDMFRLLNEVKSFARVEYANIPRIEPFNTLLTSLPGFGDKDLYALSLSIEHRAP